mgnify:CR=1 FL=1
MKIEEFDEEIDKLERFYQKEKTITDEQRQIWYRELRNLDIARFRYIIAQTYRTSKFMPKLADLLEINANLGYSQAKQEQNQNNCKICNGTGYVTYKRTTEKGANDLLYEYGAICKCRTKPKYEGWKITDEKNRSNYYIPLLDEINIGG